MTPIYRAIYNRAPTPARVLLIVLGDLWAALTIGSRFER